jgi:hypothetical protein
MQDLNHDFTTAAPHADRTAAALASIEAKRRAQVKSGYAVLAPFGGLNPQNKRVGTMVGIARLIVIGILGIAANYLLYMQVWG